jgi:hypothetical protein
MTHSVVLAAGLHVGGESRAGADSAKLEKALKPHPHDAADMAEQHHTRTKRKTANQLPQQIRFKELPHRYHP